MWSWSDDTNSAVAFTWKSKLESELMIYRHRGFMVFIFDQAITAQTSFHLRPQSFKYKLESANIWAWEHNAKGWRRAPEFFTTVSTFSRDQTYASQLRGNSSDQNAKGMAYEKDSKIH